ncbi:MAG: hypothetical protein EOP04_20465 [Proteobacteria bacterium]|nr:MAG: hypothetical protein EOP04_20465 [Pseudomonadota bacterium]
MRIADALKSVINDWLAENKKQTLSSLTGLSGLNYGTIKKLAAGTTEPNGETTLRLLLAIWPITKVHSFMMEFFPHLAPYSQNLVEAQIRVITALPELSHKHNRALLEVEFGDIAEADLKAIVGEGTEEIVDELVGADVVIRDGNTIRQKYENIHVPSLIFAKIRAGIFLDAADLKFQGTKLHNFNKSLNAEGQRRTYGVLDKAEQELAEIQRDPSLHGDIKVGASIIMTTI